MQSLKPFHRLTERHKKALFFVGIGLSVVGAIAIVMINGKKKTIPIVEVKEATRFQIPDEKLTTLLDVDLDDVETLEFLRAGHTRRLPMGYKASPEKILQLNERGIFEDGMTYVNECMVTRKKVA